MPPDLEGRIKMALSLLRGIKAEQGKAEQFVSEMVNMLAKEVGSDVKGFEEIAMRLETVKACLDIVKEPWRITQMALKELGSKYVNLSFISMEDLFTTQERLESEFEACRDLVDNPKAIYDVLVRESESKKESEVELQGPRIELSDESSDE